MQMAVIGDRLRIGAATFKKHVLDRTVALQRTLDGSTPAATAPGARAVITYGGESSRKMTPHLAAELATRGMTVDLVQHNELALEGARLLRNGEHWDLPDVIFPRAMPERNMPILHALEDSGVHVINPPEAIRAANDKAITAVTLDRAGLNQPETRVVATRAEMLSAFEEFGSPTVVKRAHGAGGSSVWFPREAAEVSQLAARLLDVDEPPVVIAQKYVPNTGARDVRVFVVRDPDGDYRTVSAMVRQGPKDGHLANGPRGNHKWRIDPTGRSSQLDADGVRTAEEATRVLGLEYAGVDLAPKSGRVFEVNGGSPAASEFDAHMPRSEHALPAMADRAAALLARA